MAQLAQRGQGRLGRAARSEDDGLLDPGQPGLPQRGDQPGHIGVMGLPTPARREDQGVRCPDRGRQR